MKLHEVLPALIEGKEIRRMSEPDLQYVIANEKLICYAPRASTAELGPFTVKFGIEDIRADDWEIAP